MLVVGGEVSIPGALILAGIASLRAGAGKLQMATCRSIAPFVGISVPEALVLGLDETPEGSIAPDATAQLTAFVAKADAFLVGPGMKGDEAEKKFVLDLLLSCDTAPVILDAGALDALSGSPDALHRFGGNAVATPHLQEMSRMLGVDESEISSNPASVALRAAKTFRSVVALKGSRTWIASPNGDLFRYDSGDVGLATSGSGDTLAGVVAGLLARGAPPLTAALWAVYLHGEAGNRLARRMGRVGYLARELLAEIPPVMNGVSLRSRSRESRAASSNRD